MVDISIFELLNAGGNLGIFGLLYIMWKFDRRLLAIELIIKRMLEKEGSELDSRGLDH